MFVLKFSQGFLNSHSVAQRRFYLSEESFGFTIMYFFFYFVNTSCAPQSVHILLYIKRHGIEDFPSWYFKYVKIANFTGLLS